METAEKSRKVEFIELLNDDLRTGKLLAPVGSLFEQDSMLVTWDRDSILRNPDKPKVADTYHSDINDAVLYAWREARHYLSEKPLQKQTIGTDPYMDELESKEASAMERMQSDPEDFELEQQIQEDMEILDLWGENW